MKARLLVCKTRFSALPVLTYKNVRCAPVLENHVFRLNIRTFLNGLISFFAFSCPAWAEESDKGGLPQLDTSLFPEQLFWLAISFALLYVLMSRVALPRVASTQGNRKRVIAAEIEAARAASETAKTTIAAVEKSLSEARAKAQATVSEMMAEVTQEAAARQLAQEKELMRTLHRAEADIAVTRAAALNKIQGSAADLAAVAVEKILGFKLRGAA